MCNEKVIKICYFRTEWGWHSCWNRESWRKRCWLWWNGLKCRANICEVSMTYVLNYIELFIGGLYTTLSGMLLMEEKCLRFVCLHSHQTLVRVTKTSSSLQPIKVWWCRKWKPIEISKSIIGMTSTIQMHSSPPSNDQWYFSINSTSSEPSNYKPS